MNIYQLGQIPEEIYPSVGGKAKGLDMLVRHGFIVPKGFVITDTEQIDEEAVYQAFDAMKAERCQCARPHPTRINHRPPMPANMRLACSWTVPI